MRTTTVLKLSIPLFILASAGLGCNNNDSNPNTNSATQTAPTPPPSLFEKYGGEPTIQKVVDDVVTTVTADPVTAPFFAVVDQPGHDTSDRLKSCLDLQFTVLFGGPGTYPSVSHYRNAPPEGYACKDMTAAHASLGITNPVFDKFLVDLATVLKIDGVSDEDINDLAPALVGFRSQIVTR